MGDLPHRSLQDGEFPQTSDFLYPKVVLLKYNMTYESLSHFLTIMGQSH